MVVRLIPPDWSVMADYTAGTAVKYNGLRFLAATGITGNANNANPIDNEAQWTFDGVLDIRDYYSLQYAVQGSTKYN